MNWPGPELQTIKVIKMVKITKTEIDENNLMKLMTALKKIGFEPEVYLKKKQYQYLIRDNDALTALLWSFQMKKGSGITFWRSRLPAGVRQKCRILAYMHVCI